MVTYYPRKPTGSIISIEYNKIRYIGIKLSLIRFYIILVVPALFLGELAVILLQWSIRWRRFRL